MENLREERLGMVNKNIHGSLMEITEYINAMDITVRFLDTGYVKKSIYDSFKIGSIKNPYDKSVHSIGYLGEGKYKPKINGQDFPQYRTWKHMLMRCYDKKYQEKYPTYKGCSVSKEWHNYQEFGKWYDENYYKINGENMELDKDILLKGNKIYSKETCIFVPKPINYLFVKSNSSRGNLPIGTHWSNINKKYVSTCKDGKGKGKTIGRYNTPEEAFLAYKTYKESLIKQIAEEYKSKIPNKLYEALLTYEVEITD